MGKREKLIERLKARPRDFTFEEAEALLGSLGFVKSNKGRTSGSRVVFQLGHTRVDMHRPHPYKELQMYQVKKLFDKLVEAGLI
jgi:hypothetical protein